MSGPASRHLPYQARPKIAIIVGPVAEYTADYKRFAAQAVAAAKRYRVDIVTVQTPDDTWPRVRAALEGASLVVYLGHGNGYPSPYRSDPWPYSENGFGVNVPGARNNDDHQYFGEYYLRREVRLAPNAVVILSHLCYASGNSEPGMPEDGQKIAFQRVDNYAAGFMAAGAAAVIADGRGSPAYYVQQVLSGHGSILDIWRNAPTFNGHVSTFTSGRSDEATGYVDPDTRNAGYYHSVVVRGHANAQSVLAGAGKIAAGRRILPALRYSLLRANAHPGDDRRSPRPARPGGRQVTRGDAAHREQAEVAAQLGPAARGALGSDDGRSAPARDGSPATAIRARRRSELDLDRARRARQGRPDRDRQDHRRRASRPRSWCRASRGSID